MRRQSAAAPKNKLLVDAGRLQRHNSGTDRAKATSNVVLRLLTLRIHHSRLLVVPKKKKKKAMKLLLF